MRLKLGKSKPETWALHPPARPARRMAATWPTGWAIAALRRLKRLKRIMIRTFTANLPLILKELMEP